MLHALLGGDVDGERVRALLTEAGVALLEGDGGTTERHLNLMTPAGERVSLYLATPTGPRGPPRRPTAVDGDDGCRGDRARPRPASRSDLIPAARATGRPIWTDIHDYDGEAEFHRPFIEAADAIFMNADRIGDDPFPFMERCIEGGASLVVCTLGARRRRRRSTSG